MINQSDTQYDYFYRRNLPHIQPPDASYFVTFRLAGSLPKDAVIRLKNKQHEIEEEIKNIKDSIERAKNLTNVRKRYFKMFDKYLGQVNHGPVWLKDERVASIVAEAMHFRDGKKYNLYSYCIMPNHVHMVFFTGEEYVGRPDWSPYTVTKILENLKWYIALKSNKILKRSGQFWQHESYDHVIRNNRELIRIVKYVLNNPVEAGFVERPEQWKWSYCREDIMLNEL